MALLNTESIKKYLISKKYFRSDEELVAKEIGNGNINYVFIVSSKDKSIVVKQSDVLLRSSKRPLDLYRSKVECRTLKLEDKYAPGFVPKVYEYDENLNAIIMEDISEYMNLRFLLEDSEEIPFLSEEIAEFLAKSMLATSDLVMDSKEKKKLVKYFINPDMCDISEDLVLTEPYYNYKNRNVIKKDLQKFVDENLYNNENLQTEICKLRYNFMNNAQALIHGDFHSGSIFVCNKGIKIIDPEFAFYGPMGYDIGNVIANLFFPLFYSKKVWLHKCIVEIFDKTFEKLEQEYDKLVTFKLYKNKEFKRYFINSIKADTCGYAGTEIIRRVVGDTKTKEIVEGNSVTIEKELIKVGIYLIMNRFEICKGRDLFQ